MRVTVIVVTFNHCAIVPFCLDALRATIGPDDEVVVVDNASSDGTAARVEAAYPWVRLHRSAKNLGYGAACNLGAAVARGDYLAILNPDTEPQPGWLDALFQSVQAAPQTELATAKVLLSQAPDTIDTYGNAVHISGITTCHGWGQPAAAFEQLEAVSAVSGACFMVSRALFHRLGGFDERLFLYFEDTDLSLRARLAGCRCIAVPDAIVLHDHRHGFSPAKLHYLERNRWWTLLKLYHWRTLIALTPVLLTSEVIAWGMAARNGWPHLVAKGHAWVDLARWLHDLPAARAAVQRTRMVPDAELLRLQCTRLPFAQAAGGALGRNGEQIAALAFGGGRAVATALGAL